MNLRCFLGFHDWRKIGGPHPAGTGKVKQRFKCERCGKVKTEIY